MQRQNKTGACRGDIGTFRNRLERSKGRKTMEEKKSPRDEKGM
jgi:hypothetical protein